MEGVAVLRDQRGVVISIGDTLLFGSGSSEIRREAIPILSEEAARPDGMSAAGYGEYRPVASNATVEGRARNRRVDIVFADKKDEI